MRVHSLTILHYGKDYLPYAIKSVYDNVDKAHVFYTPTPSHGHSTDILPIETKEQLLQAAYAYDPADKVRWYDMLHVRHEGIQRDTALDIVKADGADMIVVLDCDEVWPAGLAHEFIHVASQSNTVRNWLVNMTHFWRSFNWACNDQGWPVRIIDLRHDNGVAYLPQESGKIFHFGYAIRDKVMRYKWQIHGHKNELRQNWFDDKWSQWPPPNDCHPTNDKGFWIPEPFDKGKLPDFMRIHPFYNLERID